MAETNQASPAGTAWRRGVVYVATVAAVLAAWELLSATGTVKPLLLASPSSTWHALAHIDGIATPVFTTLRETGSAFLIATVLAVPIGLLVGNSDLHTRAYEPVLTSVSALPLVVLFPVFAATFGIGSTSKIVLGTLYAFFPMAIATSRAAHAVDRRLIVAGRTMGASRAQRLTSIVVPVILPPLLASMRVSLGLAVVTVIAAEFISGAEGIGFELGRYSQLLDTPTLFAWIVVACALTVAINITFTALAAVAQKGMNR